jgi:MoxR-like ATPase
MDHTGGGAIGQEVPDAGFRRDAALLEAVRYEVKKVVVGQDHALERLLVCLLAGGHCLLEGLPGLAKTLTVQTLAGVMGGDFARIQFTPDLVPSDIIGTRVYRASTEHFDVELGPITLSWPTRSTGPRPRSSPLSWR